MFFKGGESIRDSVTYISRIASDKGGLFLRNTLVEIKKGGGNEKSIQHLM